MILHIAQTLTFPIKWENTRKRFQLAVQYELPGPGTLPECSFAFTAVEDLKQAGAIVCSWDIIVSIENRRSIEDNTFWVIWWLND